ncbi:hypothetical protein CALVIDRAFT_563764 [Calocera viscosa TUFC12733]|uniref:Replication protein A subunit n=1 Tax=Calocera viscosa (strain TUFC12733) TaxID=1330018 RepID=A0A167MGQ8_CALVF|nr:hypothetical protein CALVIDRAFT_563764 [Calocera viscosa TUFC12733]
MAFGRPDRYSAVVQVLKVEELLKLGSNTSYRPKLWHLRISDGQNDIYTLSAGVFVPLMIELGELIAGDVIQVTGYQQGVPMGSNRSVVRIVEYVWLRRETVILGTPSNLKMDLHPDLGHGMLERTHLSAGYLAQDTNPPPPIVKASSTSVGWYTVYARGLEAGDEMTADPAPGPPAVPIPDGPRQTVNGVPLIKIAQINEDRDEFVVFARVFEIGPVRELDAAGGTKVERVMAILHDRSGEVALVAFGNNVPKVYRIDQASVNISDPQYKRVPHTYQLQVDKDTVIQEIPDSGLLPMIYFNFNPIVDVERMRINATCDVLAVVARETPSIIGTTLVRKGGDERTVSRRKELWLVDDSAVLVRFTAFDDYANMFEGMQEHVVALKNVLVDFRDGPCLKTQSGKTMVYFDDSNPTHAKLKAWWISPQNERQLWRSLTGSFSADGFPHGSMIMPNETSTIKHADDNKFGLKGEVTFCVVAKFEFRAMREDYIYMGCPFEDCNKKTDAAQLVNGVYICGICRQSYLAPAPKYRLNVKIFDPTGSHWINIFNGAASRLLNASASDMLRWRRGTHEQMHIYRWRFDEAEKLRFRMVIKATADRWGREHNKPSWVGIHMEEVPET